MGDTWGDGLIDERPVREVRITYDFYIGKYEVTFSEFDVFCKATGRIPPSDEDWGRRALPVINVTWWDAVEFCNWLSEREGLPKAYDDDGRLLDATGKATDILERVPGFRLPTEAEWEYAARGGNKNEGHKYAGSDDVDEVAWHSENSGIKPHEVGKKAPNELEYRRLRPRRRSLHTYDLRSCSLPWPQTPIRLPSAACIRALFPLRL